MQFLKNFLSSCLGALVALVLFCFVIIALFSALAQEKEVPVAENSVLHLNLDAEITEQQLENPLAGLPVPGGDDKNIGLLQLKQAIEHAKTDSNIKGIYLEVSYPGTFYSSLEEIRRSLIDFRESGKWVIAYNEVMSEGAYYVCSAADKVYLNPQGEVEFNGLTAQFTSFKKLFDKLGIRPQVFRVGEYKSAVEPFLMEKMSDENRLQLTELINSIHQAMLQRIASSRNIPQAKLKEIADKMLVRNANDAVSYGLIDSLLYKDQFEQVIKTRLGLDESKKIKYIKYNKYRKSFTPKSASKNEIAVIVADGTIMPGETNEGQQIIGADSFVEEMKKARQNEKVKAIVVRINSPGGELVASDMMWREIKLAAESKPVIASMGDFAASGGYYMAMACDTIVALDETVTGSIGIFGVMFDLSKFMDDKLGITFDEVRTGEYGEVYTFTRPLTEAEKNFWQKDLNDHYDNFVSKAAEGRDVSKEEILQVAGGRVWTGVQAQQNKLVDILGGFDDAITIAAEKAGVSDDYHVRYYPKQVSFIQRLLSDMEENSKADALRSELGEFYVWYKQWDKVKNYQGVQARMPFELVVE